MTTIGEAFQMGLSANLAVSIQNEVNCAGDALSQFALSVADTASPELQRTVSHVLNHLAVIRELAEAFDQHLDAEIKKFDEENPGKLLAVSREISENDLIQKMQDIIGMTAEERVARIQHNLAALEAEQN